MMAVRRAAPLLLMTLLGIGCERQTAAGAAADTTAVRQELEQVLTTHYAAFEQGDVARWSDLMIDSVFLSAADPTPSLYTREAVREKMEREFGPARAAGITLSIRPESHEIWVSNDGRSAASTYELNYVSTYRNREYPVKLRSSILFERDSTVWKIAAAQYSRPLAKDTLFMAVMNGRIPSALPADGSVSSAAGEVADQFRRDVADVSKAALASNVVVVMPEGAAVGATAARMALLEWLGRPGNATVASGIRSDLTPSHNTGYVACTLNVPIYAGPESGIAPIRALVIYHLKGKQWEIIQAHFSVGLPSRIS
ncbi:MAG: nuclear transport factor 2 family protein [Gemmatimonadota bacterium]